MRAVSQWNNLPREAADSLSLLDTKICLHRVLEHVVCAMLLPRKVGPNMLKFPF